MNQQPTSLVSANHKFAGTMPYRQPPHTFVFSFEDFERALKTSPEEAFIGLYGQWSPGEHRIDNCSLGEFVGYDDGSSHLFVIKRTGTSTFLNVPQEPSKESIGNIGISFVCTDNEPYVSLLRETIEHYKTVGMDLELSVVFYTDGKVPDWQGVSFLKKPRNDFHMASARNLGLLQVKSEHVFMLDADVRLFRNNIVSIIESFQTIPNHGVFNLKNDPHIGNGLYFGRKDALTKNGYNEEFKFYWYEDTEFLMNFSRIGIMPIVIFENFQRIDHSRSTTVGHVTSNFALFSNILHQGKR